MRLSSTKQKTNITYFIIGLISASIFCSIYGIHILNPTYTDWLLSGGDLSQHYLGWVAYRNSSWHFPIGMVDTLSYPHLTSIIFTDSLPIFAVFFKALSPILPDNFQYFGLWGIMSFILQGILSAKILKNFTDNRVSIVISAVLFVYTPVMILRMYTHTALASHWVILLALETIFSSQKYSNSSKLYLRAGIIGILSASIHIYFLLINGIILVGTCLLDILYTKKLKRSVWTLSIYILSAFLIVVLLGGFSSGAAPSAVVGLGLYSFNLNAFFNPQNWSCILKNQPLYIPQQYEGFAYLGAGCILLLLLAVFSFASDNRAKDILAAYWRILTTLIVICAVSITVALSPTITFGNRLICEISLPEIFFKVLSVFRASGRLAWITVYIMVLCVCIILLKLSNKRTALAVVLIALIIQVYDIHDVLSGKNATFNQKVEFESQLQTQDFWNSVAQIPEIKHIVYVDTFDTGIMYSVTDWALKNKLTTNNFHIARSAEDSISISTQNALDNLSEENLYLFSNKNRTVCSQYSLIYYEIDGFLVGYINSISNYAPAAKYKEFNRWIFGGNEYLHTGQGNDTKKGRELYPGGLSYGPYWSLPAGTYRVILSGTQLKDTLHMQIYSDYGAVPHTFEIVSESDSEVIIDLKLEKSVDTLEFAIQNISNDTILLKGIELHYAD